MNILFYLYQYPGFGGIETSASLLCNYFFNKACGVFLLAHHCKDESSFNERVKSIVTPIYMPDQQRLVSNNNKRRVAEVIDKNSIDVVVFLDSYASIEGNLFDNRDIAIPIITSERNSSLAFYERKNKNFSLRELIRRIKFSLKKPGFYSKERRRRQMLYNWSARYILHSTRFFGEFRCVTNLKDIRKLRAIPNALGLDVKDNLSVNEISERKKVLFIGSLNHRKGCHYLLQAWRDIWEFFPEWELVIVGDGPLRSDLEDFSRNQHLQNVSFEGYKKDVLSYYNDASILAFPSVREGWGLVLVEAMSQGVVPVCFNSYSSVYDIVDDNENGIMIPSFDVNAFRDALRRLMESPEEIERMSGNAVNKASRFQMKNIGEQWYRLLKEVTG